MGAAGLARAGGIFQRLGDVVVRWPLQVIGLWMVLAAVVSLTLPPLAEMAAKDQGSLLPDDAPVMASTREMREAFDEKAGDSVLIVVLTDEQGLGPADEETYRTLVAKLREEAPETSIQDFVSTPPLREILASKDNKAWTVPITFHSEVGATATQAGYKRVAEIVNKTVSGSTLTAHLTGPVANVADLTALSQRDLPLLEIGTAVVVLTILLLIYRNVITVLVPLITIGVSLVTAHGVLSGLAQLGLPMRMQTIVLMSAVMIGAGTDYTVFLISRYHDYVRLGEDSDQAVKKAFLSIGKIIAASAATVAITFLAMVFSRLSVFAQVGPTISISIVVVFVAALTLLPALLVLAGRRGWIKPRRDLTTRFWQRSGIRVVRRPRLHLISSLVVLIALTGCASLARFTYDDIKSLGDSVDSAQGYHALESHFPLNSMTPEALFVKSPRDLRSPVALADLEQMAQRVSQLPGITMVRGVTRPTGLPLEQTKLSYQAGQVGGKIDEASSMIRSHGGDMDKLAGGAHELADALAEVQGKVTQAVDNLSSLATALADVPGVKGSDDSHDDVDSRDDVDVLVGRARQLGSALSGIVTGVKRKTAWAEPVLMALTASPMCSANPKCSSWRDELEALVTARDDGTFDKIADLARNLQEILGLGDLGEPGSARTQINRMQEGVKALVEGSRALADGVGQLVDHTHTLGSGLTEAAAFLLTMNRDANKPSMAGFNIPQQVLTADEFKKAAQIFISPDGHAARYLVQSALNPFTTDAMDQVNTITAAAQSAQPNTELSDATISLTGVPTGLRDTRDYFNHDIEFIIIATIIIVFLLLVALLRAIVAPIYLIGSVLMSYLSALGIGVLVFQIILGQELHWSIPGLTFILLVALGADYNMLLISRIRDESPYGVRVGVVRTVASTGPVITSAGLIFAASMFGLLSASISALAQAGFIIGIGIVIDTFLVRTITVPALAVLIGQANWWPARLRPLNDRRRTGPERLRAPAGLPDHGIGAGARRGRHHWPDASHARHQRQNAGLNAPAGYRCSGNRRSSSVTRAAHNFCASTRSILMKRPHFTASKPGREAVSTHSGSTAWTTYLLRSIGSSLTTTNR